MINIVIVDDSPTSRNTLEKILDVNFKDRFCIAEMCESVDSAIIAIGKHKPELIFLDIEMPVMNGFDMLRLVMHHPKVIFTTAFDQYAIKAFEAKKPVMIRNPLAIRPWQHVLEPLSGYLVLAQALYQEGAKFDGGWNFGPRDADTRSVQEVINLLIKNWVSVADWTQDQSEQPHEAHSLKLDCSKARQLLNWSPRWSLEQAIENITQWQQAYQEQNNMREISLRQITAYQNS